jgi:hypothetical protein
MVVDEKPSSGEEESGGQERLVKITMGNGLQSLGV